MKEKILLIIRTVILISLLTPACSAQAKKTMREVWVTMPDSVIPYLNHNLRVELVDYWEMKADAKVKNRLDGDTKLVKMSDNYMELKLNESTDASIRLLSTGDSTYIICMVKTFKAPAEESSVMFFSSDWKPLGKNFGLPTNNGSDKTKEMFTEVRDTMTTELYDRLYGMIEPVMLKAALSETDETIVFELSLPFLTKDEKEEVSLILRQRKFKWDGKTFKEC